MPDVIDDMLNAAREQLSIPRDTSGIRQYYDIAEFGHSMHHLIDKMKDNVESHFSTGPRASWRSFARWEVGMSNLKREMRDVENTEGDSDMSERDVKIFKLALAMTQYLMGHTYSRHSMGSLDADEIFPVGQ